MLAAEIKASADQLRARVGALLRELARNYRFSEIIANSPAMLEIFNLMEAAAASSISVLIEGERDQDKTWSELRILADRTARLLSCQPWMRQPGLRRTGFTCGFGISTR